MLKIKQPNYTGQLSSSRLNARVLLGKQITHFQEDPYMTSRIGMKAQRPETVGTPSNGGGFSMKKFQSQRITDENKEQTHITGAAKVPNARHSTLGEVADHSRERLLTLFHPLSVHCKVQFRERRKSKPNAIIYTPHKTIEVGPCTEPALLTRCNSRPRFDPKARKYCDSMHKDEYSPAQRRKMERLQKVIEQHKSNNRSISIAPGAKLFDPKNVEHESDTDKVKRKYKPVHFGKLQRKLSEIEVRPGKARSYMRITHKKLIQKLEDVKCGDEAAGKKKSTKLVLPDDSGFKSIVNFMKSLQGVLEIPQTCQVKKANAVEMGETQPEIQRLIKTSPTKEEKAEYFTLGEACENPKIKAGRKFRPTNDENAKIIKKMLKESSKHNMTRPSESKVVLGLTQQIHVNEAEDVAITPALGMLSEYWTNVFSVADVKFVEPDLIPTNVHCYAK